MSHKYSFTISRKHLIAIGSALSLLVTGTAFGLSVANTPDTGYLLCSNIKTHAVIYPSKLSCPSGYSNLQLGAQGAPGQDGATGLQGPMGSTGPQGSAGTNTYWQGSIATRDLVGTAGATTFATLKKTIIASIDSSNLSGGSNYLIAADLSGLWATQTTTGTFIECYFQDAKAYPSGGSYYGSSSTTYSSWNNINLRVTAYDNDFSLASSTLYLVCATNGVVSGLSGDISAINAVNLKSLNLGAPPSS